MKAPVIGIVLDLASNNGKYSYSSRPWYALRTCYANCVTKAGGTAIMLPYNNDIDSLLAVVDGLVIPGGDEDINPRFYGREIESPKVKTNDTRAEFEINLARKAIERNMPLLGICNGLQVINVAKGGTLIQHIPDRYGARINHEQPYPKDEPTHYVNINENTILFEIAGEKRIFVNSTHHQAVDDLGTGLIIAAEADDGVIESVESQDHKFLIGVQWHCEYLNSGPDYKLFKRLVEVSSLSRYDTQK